MPWSPLGEGLREPAFEIRWLLERSPVILAIPGTSSVAHLEENIIAAQVKLSESEYAALESALS